MEIQGHDTTAMAISWTLYMLGLHEDIQEKIRVEVDSIMSLDDEEDPSEKGVLTSDVTNEHLRQMKYLDCVLKEVQRLWPTAPFIARRITEDVTVRKLLLLPLYSLFIHVFITNQ